MFVFYCFLIFYILSALNVEDVICSNSYGLKYTFKNLKPKKDII